MRSLGPSRQSRTVLATLALLATALAGCGTSESEPISVENDGAEGGKGPYTFTAEVASENDNYTWDMGDRLTTLYGKSVTHTYDIQDATLAVTLKVRQAGADQVYTTPLQLGTGNNTPAAFVLDASAVWVVTGEPITFSAARSSDPENVQGRYSWSCLVLESATALTRQPFHPHPIVGVPYQTPPAGSVTSYKANYTLPAPDTVVPGDMCETLGTGMKASTSATTIQGQFAARGKYRIFLLASDGAHPTKSGFYDFYVTNPNEKPSEWQVRTANATLQAGAGGQLQGQCTGLATGPQTCDEFTANFDLPDGLAGRYGWANVTYATGPGGATNNVTWVLNRCGGLVVTGGGRTPDSVALDSGKLPGSCTKYTMTSVLQRGLLANVTMQMTVRLDLDPFTVY